MMSALQRIADRQKIFFDRLTMIDWSSLNLTLIAEIVALVVLVGSIGIWVGHVNADRSTFKKFIDKMDTAIEKIQKELTKIAGSLPPTTITDGSPVQLTDLGKQVSEELDLKNWATLTAEELKDQVIDKEAFEIQEFTGVYLANDFSPTEDLDEKIRKCAYEHGINREKVINVFMVELRDALLDLKGDRHQ